MKDQDLDRLFRSSRRADVPRPIVMPAGFAVRVWRTYRDEDAARRATNRASLISIGVALLVLTGLIGYDSVDAHNTSEQDPAVALADSVWASGGN